MLLSLPDTWNYSVRGLSSITPDGVDGVLTALKELERLGYLERNQQRESNGRMGRAEYVIYEMPRKKPCSESPCTEKPYAVNPDNYVHGGCSPQEMLVPVLEFKMERGHMETKNAEIALVSIVHKITNLITSMDFIQSDAVSDTVKAAKYRIFFLSEDNEKISNENSYVADSREENAQKRIFRMRFTFKNKKYDKDKQYYLVVYDEESGLEQWRQPVIMDIAFADDFGFGF